MRVSWDDAKAFCESLTVDERSAGSLPAGAIYRLPSDHEWSCAADIGALENANALPSAKNKGIKRYPWQGGYWPPPADSGNYFGIEGKGHETWSNQVPIPGAGDDFPATAPVGSFPPNRFGLHDLSGNAWEWCADWVDEKMVRRVLRGASFACHYQDMFYLSHRRGYEPVRKDPDDGFRVVLELTQP